MDRGSGQSVTSPRGPASQPLSESAVLHSLRLQSELSHAARTSNTMPDGAFYVARVLLISYDGGKRCIEFT